MSAQQMVLDEPDDPTPAPLLFLVVVTEERDAARRRYVFRYRCFRSFDAYDEALRRYPHADRIEVKPINEAPAATVHRLQTKATPCTPNPTRTCPPTATAATNAVSMAAHVRRLRRV